MKKYSYYQVFSLLPNHLRNEAVREFKKRWKDEPYYGLHEPNLYDLNIYNIAGAFNWSMSKRGVRFWGEIAFGYNPVNAKP